MVPAQKVRQENTIRIYRFIGVSSFEEKVEKEKEIKNKLEKYGVERILLDSPMVIPYPRSLLAERAIYIWEENMEEPQNIGEYAPYVLRLTESAEMQLAARVYVAPEDLRVNEGFIGNLNRIIMEEIR